ncbi:hypothetical protein IVA79_33780 [Bradyrhizobium sp. 138]|uniref:hypothetical protein n=1 Tax=Bradyrhizobium sp. 138 TaxID=2782615 RepID=UPI001FF77B0A|nr:hypothetical protein [Bradyrhizobium sp. 138]MCK1738812.1 hypothetical protein [Bradyrhizobium sp. 138]
MLEARTTRARVEPSIRMLLVAIGSSGAVGTVAPSAHRAAKMPASCAGATWLRVMKAENTVDSAHGMKSVIRAVLRSVIGRNRKNIIASRRPGDRKLRRPAGLNYFLVMFQ